MRVLSDSEKGVLLKDTFFAGGVDLTSDRKSRTMYGK